MRETDLKTPLFDQPGADDLFLASKNGLRPYAHLSRFRTFFLQLLFDNDHDFDRPVGFIAPSCDELIFSVAACWQLGIPFVTFNASAPEAVLRRQIEAIDPGLIFYHKKANFSPSSPSHLSFEQLSLERTTKKDMEPGRRAKNYEADTHPEQVFGYFFTSGTTGIPKIVPLKRRQMLYAAKTSADNFKPRINHFWLLCLPLNHIGGISIILRSLLYGTAIYRTNRFDLNMISTFLSENKLFQAASLVPTMLKRLLDDKTFRTHQTFKAILLGGGPIDSGLLRESRQRGIPVVASYGMTETCAQIAANPLLKPSGVYHPLSSVGDLFEPNEIEIRDEEGQTVATNEQGIIWLKGPQVFDGYLGQAGLAFDKEGWFNTGDIGHLNVNGHLFIESRRTDLIISGGENISPFEVESELQKIDPITEAAVFGIDDKEWGQRVVAVVVAKTNGVLETESIRNQLKERLNSYKIPKEIKQAAHLPRTETGKIKRGELLKLFD